MTETQQAVDVRMERSTGDTAYGRAAVREAIAERGTGVMAPVPAPHNQGLFAKEASPIDLKPRSCTWSAGKQRRPVPNRAGAWTGFRLRTQTCATCPLRAQFTTSAKQGR